MKSKIDELIEIERIRQIKYKEQQAIRSKKERERIVARTIKIQHAQRIKEAQAIKRQNEMQQAQRIREAKAISRQNEKNYYIKKRRPVFEDKKKIEEQPFNIMIVEGSFIVEL